ncbi:Tn7-like element transposition protein TnsE [Clostridium sp. OS1-26]|uniref:Tn7-like element transposition protein TnsE n=1 Tax=Clostridium sp. OS1-26 TaxID=3070681 RepID=UPI0027E095CD|nr:Tn7-like element transposition protein TnsE [Clostridium sp. OS1-26]WML36194.1 Tn7-like element transposition protein TnsE [Clostridium sp. OS1-26]
MEFTNIVNVEEKGELEEFIEVLKLLEKRHDVKSVEITIGELPEGKRSRGFSRLSDGITKRRYTIEKMVMIDGREYSLIEVEREGRALSMLLLKANNSAKWN